MKVLMVCPSYPPQDATCGVGDYTRCLSEELARQGVAVTVATSVTYRGETDGAVTVLPTVRRWTAAGAWNLAGLAGRSGADVLHLQYAPDLYGTGSGFVLCPAWARLRARGAATMVTFHSLTGPSLWSRAAALLLLASARHCISANEEVSAMIRRRTPALWKRCSEIPIGSNVHVEPAVTPGEQPAERRRLDLPATGPLVVFFGMVYPGKGLETLVDAWAHVIRRRPDARLVIAGDTRPDDESHRRFLEERAARLSVQASVIWTGRRPAGDVSRLLHMASVFVAPFDGGLSIRHGSLMAGLAHGLPIVSTVAPLPSAHLKDGEQVILVPPRDPEALAGRIEFLLASPQEARRLGKAAAEAAVRFSWTGIAEQTHRLYARVVAP